MSRKIVIKNTNESNPFNLFSFCARLASSKNDFVPRNLQKFIVYEKFQFVRHLFFGVL
jgi:hypothetical protein